MQKDEDNNASRRSLYNDDDKEKEEKKEVAEVFQFKEEKMVEFGKHLIECIGRHLSSAYDEGTITPKEEMFGLSVNLQDFVHILPPESKGLLPVSSVDYMLMLKDYDKEKQELPRQVSFKALNSLKYIIDEAE